MIKATDIPSIPEWITSDTLYEFIDGEYVEKKPTSASATRLASRIARVINNHAVHDYGEATCEGLITLPDSTCSRRPDVIYVSYGKWPSGRVITDTDASAVLSDLCGSR